MARKVETGCRDCRKCTNSGFANAGRNTSRATAAFVTLGLSELGMAARKKCRTCGHQMSLHEVAAPTSAPASPLAPMSGGVAAELERLASLRASGVLTEEEFAAAKARLLRS